MANPIHRLRATIVRVLRHHRAATVVVCGIVAWIGAWQLGWQELAIAAAACLAAVLLAALFTVGRTDLRVETVINPQRVVVGERAVGELTVTNVARRRMLPVRLELPVGSDVAVIDVPSLAAAHSFEETIVVPSAPLTLYSPACSPTLISSPSVRTASRIAVAQRTPAAGASNAQAVRPPSSHFLSAQSLQFFTDGGVIVIYHLRPTRIAEPRGFFCGPDDVDDQDRGERLFEFGATIGRPAPDRDIAASGS